VDASGGNLKQMTPENWTIPLNVPRAVYFTRSRVTAHESAVEGGASQKVSEYTFQRIAASPTPSSRLSVRIAWRPKEKLAVVSLDAGQTPKLLELEKPRESAFPDSRVRFSRDGKAVVYSVRTAMPTTCGCSPWMALPAPNHDFKSELIRAL